MTVQELKEKYERLTARSECTVWNCEVDEKADYLEISHKGTSKGCFWVITYSGSLSEYLRQETEFEELHERLKASAPTGQARRANRPPRRRWVAGK